jgi:phosphoglycolate phosphatase-like HAD superfamily hydrolase
VNEVVNCRPHVSLLVTDFDNTLYDWFAMWYPAFQSMFEAVAHASGVDRDILINEIREIHQKRGTAEYSHLLEEIPSLINLHPHGNIREIYDEAIHRYRSARQKALRLYPTVRETLEAIKRAGIPIVVYTESLAYHSASRIRALGLDGVVDYLYSPPDHDLPEGVTRQDLRSEADESYEMVHTIARTTAKGVLKPNTEIIREIIQDVKARVDATTYIGDSLMKDVAMGQDIGTLDVWARYGTVQHRREYDLLRAVSHWTEDDVAREREMSQRPTVVPTYQLERHFSEILGLFRFGN